MKIFLHFSEITRDHYLFLDEFHLYFTSKDVEIWIENNSNSGNQATPNIYESTNGFLLNGLWAWNGGNHLSHFVHKIIFDNSKSAGISVEAVEFILTRFIDLKEIALADCKNLENLKLSDTSFDSLEKINLEESNIYAHTVAQLFSQAKKLKKLIKNIVWPYMA